jgi:hypothetical protein
MLATRGTIMLYYANDNITMGGGMLSIVYVVMLSMAAGEGGERGVGRLGVVMIWECLVWMLCH